MTRVNLISIWKNKIVRIILIGLGALLLLFAVWKVFFNTGSTAASGYAPTEQERKLVDLLTQIDGIDDASVFITLQEGNAMNAVIVYKGTDSILLRSRIMNIASATLNLDKQSVQIYPSAS